MEMQVRDIVSKCACIPIDVGLTHNYLDHFIKIHAGFLTTLFLNECNDLVAVNTQIKMKLSLFLSVRFSFDL